MALRGYVAALAVVPCMTAQAYVLTCATRWDYQALHAHDFHVDPAAQKIIDETGTAATVMEFSDDYIDFTDQPLSGWTFHWRINRLTGTYHANWIVPATASSSGVGSDVGTCFRLKPKF